MLDYEKDTKVAIEFLNRNSSCYFKDGYNYLYRATNEDLKAYFYIFPIECSNIITISSSGDHILEAIKYYPKSITAFDKNKFALYLSKLKIESIKTLDVNNFNKFFYGDESEFFNINIYKTFRENLNEDTRYFWDRLYVKGNLIENLNYLFLHNSIYPEYNKQYLKESEYESIKDNIDTNITFIYSEFFDLTKKIRTDTKYSSVFLSNIYDWIGNTSSNLHKYIDYIHDDLSKYLTSNALVALYTSISGSRQKGLEKYTDTILNFDDKTRVYVYERKKHL